MSPIFALATSCAASSQTGIYIDIYFFLPFSCFYIVYITQRRIMCFSGVYRFTFLWQRVVNSLISTLISFHELSLNWAKMWVDSVCVCSNIVGVLCNVLTAPLHQLQAQILIHSAQMSKINPSGYYEPSLIWLCQIIKNKTNEDWLFFMHIYLWHSIPSTHI